MTRCTDGVGGAFQVGAPDSVVGESGGRRGRGAGEGGKPWPCRERAGEERSWNAVEGLEILGRGVSVLTPVENYFICFWKST